MKDKKITWSLIEVKPSDIKPNENNPKVRDAKGFKRLQKSLNKFGKVFDGICNKDLSLIDGHSRLELNSDEKLKVFVPSRQLSEQEYLEMNAVFDIAKAGDTDIQIIEETFTDEFFEEWEIDKPAKFAIEDDYTIPETIKTTIKTGDLFELGKRFVICKSCNKKHYI